MSLIKFHVKGIPPGKKKRVIYCEFEENDWQWAEKARSYLEDKGVTLVIVEEIIEEGPKCANK